MTPTTPYQYRPVPPRADVSAHKYTEIDENPRIGENRQMTQNQPSIVEKVKPTQIIEQFWRAKW